MRATPTVKMLWLTMVLAGLAVLVASEDINTTSTASPKVLDSTTTKPTTTQPPPPFAAVMDIFQAPLAAFKPQMEDKNDKPMGRDQQNTATTPAPSNIFFKAGSGLGSAASSLTGWFNNRMIPQVFRPSSTTTAAPEVFAIIPNQQVRRKVLVATQNAKRPVLMHSDELEDDEQETNDDEDNYEFNSNRDTIEDDHDDEDDDEDDYEPVNKRKGLRQTQKRPNRQYFYIEEELAENDDFDYDVQLPPVRKTQKKQQNLANRRRKNPPKKTQQKRRKPVRKIQNPQIVQVVQNRPSSTQVKRKRRPAATFELVPISPNQAMSSIQTTKPNSNTQNNQQRPVSQFFSIPWSRLGFAGPPKDPNSTEQQSKPIIVQIPQQNMKRKRRPTKKPAKPVNLKRKPLRGQLQNQSPVFSILNEDQIREIFKTQLNQPSKTTPQTSNLPVTLDTKKKPPKNQSEEVPSNDNDNKPEEEPQAQSEAENHEEDANAYIVVGPADEDDNKEIDLNLYRHFSNQRGFKRGRASPRVSHRWETEDDYEE